MWRCSAVRFGLNTILSGKRQFFFTCVIVCSIGPVAAHHCGGGCSESSRVLEGTVIMSPPHPSKCTVSVLQGTAKTTPLHLKNCSVGVLQGTAIVSPLDPNNCTVSVFQGTAKISPFHLRNCSVSIPQGATIMSPLHPKNCSVSALQGTAIMSPLHPKNCSVSVFKELQYWVHFIWRTAVWASKRNCSGLELQYEPLNGTAVGYPLYLNNSHCGRYRKNCSRWAYFTWRIALWALLNETAMGYPFHL